MKKDKVQHIHVACGIIERDRLVLSVQRKAGMRLGLKWEFPGGKIEAGESAEECLKRELVEELGVQVSAARALDPVTHTYPFFTVTLYPFVCTIVCGEIVLHEHAAMSWLPPEKLLSLDWAEADIPLIEKYLQPQRSRSHP